MLRTDDKESGGAAGSVAAVRSHRDDGTPVLRLPSTVNFRFAYGPGSFTRHEVEARRLGLEFRQIDDPDLAFDLDLPEDLDALECS